MTVGAAAKAPVGDPDPDLVGGRRSLERQQLERGGASPGRVVLVGVGSAEDAVEIRPLVAKSELEHIAAVTGEHALRSLNELVELVARGFVGVVVDPAEGHEHRIGRTELCQELARSGRQTLVHRRKKPWVRKLAGQLLVLLGGGPRLWPGPDEALDDVDGPCPVGCALLAQLDLAVQRCDG